MFLLFDIGGTKLRVATSEDGQTLARQKTIPTPKDFEEAILQFQLIVRELTRGEKIKNGGGGIRGILNQNKSKLKKDHILTDWVDKPIKDRFQEITNCPIFLENDTALVGLGEAINGAGQNHQIVAYITVSTGVGGVRIVNKKIDQNSLGFEPGHQVIVVGGNICGCGGSGHLEAYISGSAIEKIHHQNLEKISSPLINDEISKYLAAGINNLVVHWSPDIVVVGGSVGLSLPMGKIEQQLKENLKVFTPPSIVKANLEDEAGLYGALEYLKQLS